MRITPGGVHNKYTWVLAHGLCKRLWTLLDDDVAPALLTRDRRVERWAIGVVAILELGNNDFVLEAGFALEDFCELEGIVYKYRLNLQLGPLLSFR